MNGGEIVFAWELGAGTGHVVTLHPIALAMQRRGCRVRFLQRELSAGADLEGAQGIVREAAPVWVGPVTYTNPLSFGEILHNFGYHHPKPLRQLVDAWRERLKGASGVVCNVAPAAHLAARTLGIPSVEASQGFHIPPPVFPAPPLRDWEPAPRARLEEADRRVLAAMNEVLGAYGAAPLATIGSLFAGRAMLLTYPELDIYPERGPAEYFGIPSTSEGAAVPEWPEGTGPRVFAYLYGQHARFETLVEGLARCGARALVFARGAPATVRDRHRDGPVRFSDEPMAVSRVLPTCDLVLCHASHQMTAQALLAGKPLLMAPTQLEQFIIMRRCIRHGFGLGLDPGTPDFDIGAAVHALHRDPKYRDAARRFAARDAGHERAARDTLVERCIEVLSRPAHTTAAAPASLAGLERRLAEEPGATALWTAALRLVASGAVPEDAAGSGHPLRTAPPLRVAVVTPYCRETLEAVERCHRSVLAQTYPCHHILVADGHPHDAIDGWNATHLRLDGPHADFGDAARAAGGALAAERGFDAVAYLDADNTWRPRHVEALVARHVECGAPILYSGRTLHFADGMLWPHVVPADDPVDTSCLMLTRAAFALIDAWTRYPRILSAIGDRMVVQRALALGYRTASSGALTVRYTLHPARGERIGDAPPERPASFDGEALRRWFLSLDEAALAALDEQAGFAASRFVPECLARLGFPCRR